MQPQEASLTVNEQVRPSPAPSPPPPTSGRAKEWGAGVQQQPEPHCVGVKTPPCACPTLTTGLFAPTLGHADVRLHLLELGCLISGCFLMAKRRREVPIPGARLFAGDLCCGALAACSRGGAGGGELVSLLVAPRASPSNVTRGKSSRDSEGSHDPGSEPWMGS